MALLTFITAILEVRNIPYWLDQGTLLGLVRGGDIIPWTNDVDISVSFDDFPAVIAMLEEVSGNSTKLSPLEFAMGGGAIYTLQYMIVSLIQG